MIRPLINWLKQHPIPAFFVLTFFFAWSLWLPLGCLFPENPLLSLPGAWAPTLSSFILIWLIDGRDGLHQFLKKLFHWRIGFQWYLVVLFGIALLAYTAIGIGSLFDIPAPEISLPNGLPREMLIASLPVLFLINIFLGGPLAEDIGWRGYILPKLRERMSALNASLIIGVVWAIWHLPYFVFPAWRGAVGNIPFLWFMLLTTSWSVLFAWIYVNTESVLMPVFFHATINTTLGTLGVLGQTGGDLRLLIINIILTWVAVGILIRFFGNSLKGRAVAENDPGLGF